MSHRQDDGEALAEKLAGRDRIGVAGDVLVTTAGAAAGAAAAGTVAAAAGASTIAGSTILGSVLGGVFVAATPLGWVVGTVVVGGAAAYALSRIVHSGGIQDERRRRWRETLAGRGD